MSPIALALLAAKYCLDGLYDFVFEGLRVIPKGSHLSCDIAVKVLLKA